MTLVTRDYLLLLLDYHYWARDRLFQAVGALTSEQYARPMGSSFASVRDTLNHTYFAEWVWHSRWQGESPSAFPAAAPMDVEALRSLWVAREAMVRAFVSGQSDADIARPHAYTLFNGTASQSPLWQMVVHVVNHATYHRGQVTTLLRQLGAAPAKSMDMIAFFRERSAGA